jgi:hypothetical protein
MNDPSFDGADKYPGYSRSWYTRKFTNRTLLAAIGLFLIAAISETNTLSNQNDSRPNKSVLVGTLGCVAVLGQRQAHTLSPSEYSSATGEVNMTVLDTNLATIPGESSCSLGQFVDVIRVFNPGAALNTSGLNIYHRSTNSANNQVIEIPTALES